MHKTTTKSNQTDTLTNQAVAEVRAMLELGELGEPILPERQMAQLLGISRVTMRRAMAALEEDGIVKREQGRGTYSCYGPDFVSIDELRRIKNASIAVLSDHPGGRFNPQVSPWTWQICRNLKELIAKQNVELLFVKSDDFLEAAERGALDKAAVKGYIAPTHVWDPSRYEQSMGVGMPFVGIGRTSRSMCWNIIDLDHSTALVDTFNDLNPQPQDRVFIPIEPHPIEVDRQAWFETVLLELSRHGLSSSQIVVKPGGMFETQGYLAMKWYLREYGAPSIVIADFDLCIIGVYRALLTARESGAISASEIQKVRCLGGGDLEIGRRIRPSFNTLRFRSRSVAELALKMLEEQRAVGHPVGLRYIQAEYIRRRGDPD